MRNYIRKTHRGEIDSDMVRSAVKMVTEENFKIPQVANNFGINKRSLARYVKKFSADNNFKFGYSYNKQIFTKEQEADLEEYLKRSCDIYFGLTPSEVLRLNILLS